MKSICDQCRRVIETWKRPTLYANRIFCDARCADDYQVIQDHVYGSQQPSPIEDHPTQYKLNFRGDP